MLLPGTILAAPILAFSLLPDLARAKGQEGRDTRGGVWRGPWGKGKTSFLGFCWPFWGCFFFFGGGGGLVCFVFCFIFLDDDLCFFVVVWFCLRVVVFCVFEEVICLGLSLLLKSGLLGFGFGWFVDVFVCSLDFSGSWLYAVVFIASDQTASELDYHGPSKEFHAIKTPILHQWLTVKFIRPSWIMKVKWFSDSFQSLGWMFASKTAHLQWPFGWHPKTQKAKKRRNVPFKIFSGPLLPLKRKTLPQKVRILPPFGDYMWVKKMPTQRGPQVL